MYNGGFKKRDGGNLDRYPRIGAESRGLFSIRSLARALLTNVQRKTPGSSKFRESDDFGSSLIKSIITADDKKFVFAKPFDEPCEF